MGNIEEFRMCRLIVRGFNCYLKSIQPLVFILFIFNDIYATGNYSVYWQDKQIGTATRQVVTMNEEVRTRQVTDIQFAEGEQVSHSLTWQWFCETSDGKLLDAKSGNGSMPNWDALSAQDRPTTIKDECVGPHGFRLAVMEAERSDKHEFVISRALPAKSGIQISESLVQIQAEPSGTNICVSEAQVDRSNLKPTTSCYDNQGNLTSLTTELMGHKLRYVLSESDSERIGVSGLDYGLIIPVQGILPVAAESVRYELSFSQPVQAGFPESPIQKTIFSGARSVCIQLSRKPDSQNSQPNPFDFEMYTMPTEIVDFDNAIFTEISDYFLPDSAKLPENQLKQLWKKVHQYIVFKDSTTQLSRASEAAQQRRGDCTEHAILFAAIARSGGIPTQLIIGLRAVEQNGQHSFALHMWNRCYLGSAFIDIDPSCTMEVNPLYYITLKMVSSESETIPSLSSILNVLPVPDSIKIRSTLN